MADTKPEPAQPTQPAQPPRAEPKTKPEKEEKAEPTPGGTQDDLNPAFAGPESQEKTKKDWTKGAEHTVDAKDVAKEEKADAKDAK